MRPPMMRPLAINTEIRGGMNSCMEARRMPTQVAMKPSAILSRPGTCLLLDQFTNRAMPVTKEIRAKLSLDSDFPFIFSF